MLNIDDQFKGNKSPENPQTPQSPPHTLPIVESRDSDSRLLVCIISRVLLFVGFLVMVKYLITGILLMLVGGVLAFVSRKKRTGPPTSVAHEAAKTVAGYVVALAISGLVLVGMFAMYAMTNGK